MQNYASQKLLFLRAKAEQCPEGKPDGESNSLGSIEVN
jgi:hypothetical protein